MNTLDPSLKLLITRVLLTESHQRENEPENSTDRLYAAIEAGRVAEVRQLLHRKKVNVNAADASGKTLLARALLASQTSPD